ncbi:hypothetical protein DPSP01_006164 [Paraphaeosphaeria sporulosa]
MAILPAWDPKDTLGVARIYADKLHHYQTPAAYSSHQQSSQALILLTEICRVLRKESVRFCGRTTSYARNHSKLHASQATPHPAKKIRLEKTVRTKRTCSNS